MSQDIQEEGGVPQEVLGMIEVALVGAAYRDADGRLQTGFFFVEHPKGHPQKAIFHLLEDKIDQEMVYCKTTPGLNKNLLAHYLRLQNMAAPPVPGKKEQEGGKAEQL